MHGGLQKNDYDILKRFEFDRPPIGVKYTFKRPEQIARLDEKNTLCTMLKRAQEGHAFYADKNNFTCGHLPLGMEDDSPVMQSGDFAACFEDCRRTSFRKQILPTYPENTKRFNQLCVLFTTERVPI